jgi:hypothetical protein
LEYCVSAQYIIRQHDANGNFLAETTFTAEYIPPESHIVYTLPFDLTGELRSDVNNGHQTFHAASNPA